jgi:non-specific serine/threonine protein kinase
MAAQICKALDHAHSKGIIHRDLKLENIIVTDSQTLKLMDFGLARSSDDSRMTEEGILKGTLAYIAPELIQGEPASAQSDLYAFGVILYELLTGHAPFQGTMTVVLSQHLNGIVTPPSEHNQQIPAWVDSLVFQLLAKSPEERPASAKAVLLILEGQSTSPVVFSSPQPRSNLPTNLSKFIGREKEIAEVKQALSEYRLVTLTGSGGVGKTRLSLQVATELLTQFSSGTWFVELAPITDPDLIPQVILTSAEMQIQQGRSALDSLMDFLREKTSLLVLDNCEHLIEACAKLADMLLNAAPNLKILASSREALGVKGEQAWHVPSLSIPDLKHLPDAEHLSQYESVRLFVDRAVLSQPHFAVTDENANAVAQICSRLDGIPLAIELAAARVKVLKAEQIAERLNDRFRLLTGGSRTALPRQQTLRALIDWSYDLLSENEKLLLRSLAVFMGGCTLEAAEQVCSDGQIHAEDLLDLLIHLVDKSLVVVDEHPGQLCYRMLETVRQYAREKLLESGEGERLHTRHLAYFLKFTEEAEPHLFRTDQIEWLDRLELDDDNLRAALDWAVDDPRNHPPEAALRLCNALWYFWFVRGYESYGKEWMERALSKPGQPQVTVARGRALGYFANLASMFRADSQVLELPLEESLEIGHALRDRQGVAFALYVKGRSAWSANNIAVAKTFLSESLNIYQEINHQWGLARVLFTFGQIHDFFESDYPTARRYYEESLQIYREIGERRGMAYAVNNLGNLALNQGDWAGARSLFEQTLSLSRELGDKHGISIGMAGISITLLGQGIDHSAGKSLEEWLAESLTIARELGDRNASAEVLVAMGRAARFQNNYEEALKLHTEDLIYAREVNDEWLIVHNLLPLGELARLENNYAAALSYLLEALSVAKEMKDRQIIAYLFDEFAALGVAQGQANRSVTLFGAAEVLRAAIQVVLFPVERAEVDKNIAAARAQLSEDEFNKAWAEGKVMTMEEAVKFALEESK